MKHPDFASVDAQVVFIPEDQEFTRYYSQRRLFFVFKRAFDIAISIALLPLLLIFSVALLLFNPFFNAGPLFFFQKRMGHKCKPFVAIKFRSMKPEKAIMRRFEDPLEHDRITGLGRILRKTRVDELPQILNVLRGDMSLIGPRPDYFEHACQFLATVPGYRQRHMVRPGISGYAQTEVGYVEGVEATKKKVEADLHYINNSGFRLETWIFWRTLSVIFNRAGS